MTIEITSPLDAAEENELFELKARMDADAARYKELTDKLKAEQSEDGIIVLGDNRAVVLYSQERLNDKMFLSKYARETHLFKTVPDTVKVRKAFTEEEFSAVATQIRGVRVTTVMEALAAAKKAGKE